MKRWVLTGALVLLPLTVALAADPPGAKPAGRSAVPAVQRPVGTLAIDGVQGDRPDGLVDVLTISGNCPSDPAAGAQAAASPRDAASGLASGKRHYKPFTITKPVDKASPKLAEAAASGKKIPRVQVKQEYMVLTLENVIVTSYKTAGGGSSKIPIESFSLNFTKCTRS